MDFFCRFIVFGYNFMIQGSIFIQDKLNVAESTVKGDISFSIHCQLINKRTLATWHYITKNS